MRQYREVQLKIEPRPQAPGLDSQPGSQRGDQLASDREAKPRAREATISASAGAAERQGQALQRLGGDTGAGVAPPGLDGRRPRGRAARVHAPLVGELEGGCREV